jgi:hypothetical protein
MRRTPLCHRKEVSRLAAAVALILASYLALALIVAPRGTTQIVRGASDSSGAGAPASSVQGQSEAAPAASPPRVVAPSDSEVETARQRRAAALAEFLRANDAHVIEIRTQLLGSRCVDLQNGNAPSIDWDRGPLSVQLWECASQRNQIWVRYRDGTVRARVDESRCLAAATPADVRTPGSYRAVVTTCTASSPAWDFAGDGRIRAQLPRPGKEEVAEFCLAAPSASDGALLEVRPCTEPVDPRAIAWVWL